MDDIFSFRFVAPATEERLKYIGDRIWNLFLGLFTLIVSLSPFKVKGNFTR